VREATSSRRPPLTDQRLSLCSGHAGPIERAAQRSNWT
jgi:hypothetical protein